jgi:hypothetical protein
MPRSAEKELQEFLAALPAWQGKVVRREFSSLFQDEVTLWMQCESAELDRLKHEYESIIKRIPGEWTKYRERSQSELDSFGQQAGMLPPKGCPGAPQKEELAQQAALLQQRGMKNPQIAAELNKTLEKENQTTAEAVRKLLARRSKSHKSQTDKI